ncbi:MULTISPECIES: hypothetical protein [Maribacter]|uniref:Chain length determinant protein n=1 Tax=Maribacter stanieri TaxID=440514 RepID=A0A1I6HU61_9FLAO|nr:MULTISPECIES: hypothetical protein [Maribacter]SFR57969.1 hypothetical protein SAMN04488010_0775 [Maribacter stanieri]|tara:strand:- start:997 stop:1992 length:996 start_codon:yes stop_codon:yes gene_type:complete
MNENQIPDKQNSSDEIDLGQLFQLIGNGFNAIFNWFLRVFLYLKRNLLLLIVLVVIGLAIGYGLNQIISEKYKSEVIVKPQLESKNYLYDVVNEIQSNIQAKDTLFFNTIGIDDVDFTGLKIEIGRVAEASNSESDLKYLELLQSFENTDAIADIVREELQNKSSFNHRITFYYNNAAFGKEFAKKVLDYINSNSYFNGLLKIYRNNAQNRIEQDEKLLKQVDEIIVNYTNGLVKKGNNTATDKIILDNQEQVNIADIFEYKTGLIRDIETKKLELEERTVPVSVINLGETQVEHKSFFGKSIVLIPILLVLGFFIFSALIYLNKKAKSLM